MSLAQNCYVCGTPVEVGRRLVVVSGRAHRPHCSERCLQVTVRELQSAGAKRRLWTRAAGAAALVLALGVDVLWRHHAPPRASISYDPPDVRPKRAAPAPVFLGPAWPPTDDDWIFAFNRVSWTSPLPGPARRKLVSAASTLGVTSPKEPAPACREEGVCGVDLGGELWGEHVYAALDGVVDRVQRYGNEDHGGTYVRLAHLGGTAFTQYFHLAAVPRTLARGAHVRAGDMIGLLGDTGLEKATRHLTFALSVRPSIALTEVYWNPGPWLHDAKLRTPAHGTVAGLVPTREP